MSKIIHRRDPAGITAPIIYDVENNVNVLNWLGEKFTSQDDLCGDLACSFVLNQKEIFRSDHDNVDESLLDFTLGENDQLIIVNRPAGLDPITVAIIISAVAVTAAVISFAMIPKLPGAEDARNESPNNRLNAASNEFRPGQGIPECFGSGVSYPDFIQPSYYFYENNIKKVVGLFCISAGEVIVDEARVGDTDITSIPESSANVYTPGNKPSDEFLTIHQASANVDGQVLVAPDDESLIQTGLSLVIINLATLVQVQTTQSVAEDLLLTDDSYLYIRSPDLDGVFEIFSVAINEITEEAFINIIYAGTYTGASPVTGDLGRGYAGGVIGEGTSGELDYWVGFFDTPGEAAEEVFIHWQAPTGVRAANGGSLTLEVRFEIENIDTALTFTKDDEITNNTFDPQFITTKFTSSEFPTMTAGQYKVRARRLTDVVDTGGAASEQLKLEAYVSVTPYSVTDFGDVTTLLVQRKATSFSPDQSGQKINVDYRRKLPYYNRITDTYEAGNLQPTNAFADAVAYTLIVRGNETEASVNLDELYAIQDDLFDPRLGYFTFTFNDADLSKGERIESICNAARTVSFHDGKQWRFSRDEVKPVRSAMFNRRSVTGNNAKQIWQPQRDDDADSVRIIYVDPFTNTEAYEERAFDIGTGQITSGEVGNIPIEIKLAGCRDAYQASNRADLEIRRIAYQRRSVNEIAYRDALEIDLLDRVGWVDINDIDTFDGEILGINGDIYDTTERFTPDIAKSYVVFLTDDEGYPSNTVTCTARTDTEFGFIATGLSGAYVPTGDQQIGSRYFIADADDMEASNFTLKARTPNTDGTVGVELIEYKEDMYEKDTDTPPPFPPILADNLIALETDVPAATANARFILQTDGQISLDENGFDLWYSGGITTDIGDQFEVYASIISGTLWSGTVGSWLPITSDVQWSNIRIAIEGTTETVLKLTIREVANPSSKVSNTVTIRSVIA